VLCQVDRREEENTKRLLERSRGKAKKEDAKRPALPMQVSNINKKKVSTAINLIKKGEKKKGEEKRD